MEYEKVTRKLLAINSLRKRKTKPLSCKRMEESTNLNKQN